ncbi:MAG: ankyrin repeat domain-containing protein, partial [Bacteroidota bacterium]
SQVIVPANVNDNPNTLYPTFGDESSICEQAELAAKEKNYPELRRLLTYEDISCMTDTKGSPSPHTEIVQGLLQYGADMSIDHRGVVHISAIGFQIKALDVRYTDCQDKNYKALSKAINKKDENKILELLATKTFECPLNVDGVTNDFPFIQKLTDFGVDIEFNHPGAITVYSVALDIDFDMQTGSLENQIPASKFERPMNPIEQAPEEWTCEHLIQAVEQGDITLVQEMTKTMECNCYHQITQTTTTNGETKKWSMTQTPLGVAAQQGNTKMIDLLISLGADLNYTGPDGRTPLMNASLRGKALAVQELINKGANPNAKDQEGRTALDFAEWRSRTLLQVISTHFDSPQA